MFQTRLLQLGPITYSSGRRLGPPMVAGEHSQVKMTGLINNIRKVWPAYVCNCPMIDFACCLLLTPLGPEPTVAV